MLFLILIFKYLTHVSVSSIREKSAGHNSIHIHSLNRTEVETALQNLNTRKSTGWDGISPKALKVAANEIARPLTTLYNACIVEGEWPTTWKKGKWTPIYKKENPYEKDNYRPITVQVTINKIFQQLLSRQLANGFNDRLSDKLTAYRKNQSCETALLSLTENWKMALDNHQVVGLLSTDMSKAFDFLYHPLLLAKLRVWGTVVYNLWNCISLIGTTEWSWAQWWAIGTKY